MSDAALHELLIWLAEVAFFTVVFSGLGLWYLPRILKAFVKRMEREMDQK